jgi:hypothetical protein
MKSTMIYLIFFGILYVSQGYSRGVEDDFFRGIDSFRGAGFGIGDARNDREKDDDSDLMFEDESSNDANEAALMNSKVSEKYKDILSPID